MAAARFFVRGRVQGVWFRASTRDVATRLGPSGHARNLADGRVDVLAIGDDEAIEALAAWLHHGPPSARVEGVVREAAAMETVVGFEVA